MPTAGRRGASAGRAASCCSTRASGSTRRGGPVKVGRATAANGAPTDTSHFVYAGLGAVEARDRIDLFGNWESEEYRADALGNNLESRDGQSKDVAGYCSFAPGMRSLSSSQPIGITFESSGLMRSAFQQTLLSR